VPGTVTFYDGTTRIGRAPAPDGTATLALPPGLRPGAHRLRAVFAPGDPDRYARASATAPFTMVGAHLRLSPRLRHPGKRRVRATITLVGATAGVATFYDGKRVLATARVRHGRLTVTLPRNLRPGRHTITATVACVEAGVPITTVTNKARLRIRAR
jgi:hypothetical protein